ncbi:MAG: glucosamine kinase [Alteromonadaceae bacterium]|jgi:glucosamine kinase
MIINNNETLFVGIDGGGTKCRVQIETAAGKLLGQGIGGTANPSHGLDTVIESIMTAVNMALTQANLSAEQLPNLVVGAGLAGLHLPRYTEMMDTWQHPFKALYLTDDLHVATLGAHAGNDGAVMIVGTGFSALSVVSGNKTAIGGHGFLQADYCSGSWIGYQAVQAALLAEDKLASTTQLSELLFEHFNVRGLALADKLVGAGARQYGALAPLVFNAAKNNDATAQYIIKQSCDFINKVVRLLIDTKPPRISLLGGIAEQVVTLLDNDIITQLVPAIDKPEQGAIYFAHQQFNINEKIN